MVVRVGCTRVAFSTSSKPMMEMSLPGAADEASGGAAAGKVSAGMAAEGAVSAGAAADGAVSAGAAADGAVSAGSAADGTFSAGPVSPGRGQHEGAERTYVLPDHRT